MAKQRKGKMDDNAFWFIAIFLMVIGLAPIGVMMIIWKLFIQKEKPKDLNMPTQTPLGARTTGIQKKWSDPLQELSKKAKRRLKWGGLATAFWGFCTVMGVVDSLFWLPEDPLYFLEDVMPLLGFLIASGGFLVSGLLKSKQVRRFRSYLAMIGKRSQMSISALASAMDRPAEKVRADLSDMLDMGVFSQGFLDYGSDRLVLSDEGVQEPEPKPKAEAKPEPEPKKEQEKEDAILSEIRAVNDAVANEKLSAQIDRIGVITAKILDYQRSHPEKAPALHSFLSYYLPTTLKILRAYGQLESQDVKGANITAAMERIEGMMDKVVEGFEKQLDQLFLGDTMDITSDVEVLERMLAKDGLSGEGLTLNF